MTPHYFDVHSHIQFSEYEADRSDVLKRMYDENAWSLVVGTDNESSEGAVRLAEKNEGLFATIGIHPTGKKGERFNEELFEKLTKRKKVVAVGECGLDYYRIKQDELESKKKEQEELFIKHVEFALGHDLPLMLHCRPSKGTMDAYEDVLKILNSKPQIHNSKLRGNVHFFVGDISIAKQFLILGFTLSFTGVITFARDYDEVVRFAPLDMILSETDCPFVSPIPFRGKRNEPVYVKEVVREIADIRGDTLQKVEEALVSNAIKVFDIT